jgi:diguanylate cyclase (GGDEF)-like protein/PAS domain S-box-containing protein
VKLRGKVYVVVASLALAVAVLLLGAGQVTQNQWLLSALGIGLAVGMAALLFVYIEKTLLKPLRGLKDAVRFIAQGGDVAKRVQLPNQGEFSQLATNINDMLEALESVKLDLENTKTRYALAATGSNDGLWDWDLKNNTVFYSSRWFSLLGQPDSREATIETWLEKVHLDDRERVESYLNNHLEGHSRHFESEHRLLHADGSHRWMLVRGKAVRDEHDQAIRMAGSLTDMSARGMFDTLTGLPNRTLLMDRLGHALRRSHREPKRSALLVVDLNRFKVVNDSLGHYVGDLLLAEVSSRLQSALRTGDTVARLGADEFVLLLENMTSEADLLQIMDRLERELSRAFDVNGHHITTGCSLGIVADLALFNNADEVLRNAEIAMYSAKASGKLYAFFEPAMFNTVVSARKTEQELKHAVENNEFFLLYQPIVSLSNNQVQGFEALLRWQHPERGLVNPGDFIPLAEETGLIVPLGTWVLREACLQMSRLQHDVPPLFMSVNVSARQLEQHDFVVQVKKVLQETGLRANRLKLEITESAVIENPKLVRGMLVKLKELGVQICMDDFGTGYSSLSHLHILPLDTLKIDRSFIKELQNDPNSFAIVRTMMELAKSLGIDVVSEGVELVEQAELLKDLNCRYAQGYLFSHPVSLQEARDLKTQELGVGN